MESGLKTLLAFYILHAGLKTVSVGSVTLRTNAIWVTEKKSFWGEVVEIHLLSQLRHESLSKSLFSHDKVN